MSIAGCTYAENAFKECLTLIERIESINYDFRVAIEIKKAIEEIQSQIHACQTGYY